MTIKQAKRSAIEATVPVTDHACRSAAGAANLIHMNDAPASGERILACSMAFHNDHAGVCPVDMPSMASALTVMNAVGLGAIVLPEDMDVAVRGNGDRRLDGYVGPRE